MGAVDYTLHLTTYLLGLVPRRTAVAMAVAAANRAITTWLKWELGNLLATVGTGPRTLDHRSVATITTIATTTSRTIATFIAKAVATLERVETIFARLKGELGDLRTTATAGPVTLNHRLARKTTTVIIAVHIDAFCYVLLTHDPLERINARNYGEPSHGPSNVSAYYVFFIYSSMCTVAWHVVLLWYTFLHRACAPDYSLIYNLV